MDKISFFSDNAVGKQVGGNVAVHLNETAIAMASSAYAEGRSLAASGDLIGISRSCLTEVFKSLGLPIRNASQSHRVHSLNEHAFDASSNSPEASYFAGLLFADGCVTRKQQQAQITLALSGDDGAHLEKFQSFLGHDGPLYYRSAKGRRQRSTILTVSSCLMADALAKYGIVPRKSFTAIAKGGMESNRHFWRGVIDGDGCLYTLIQNRDGKSFRYPYVELVGSCASMWQFKQFVETNNLCCSRPVRRKNIWRVVVCGSAAFALAKLLYGDGLVSLPRKQSLADEFFSRYALKFGAGLLSSSEMAKEIGVSESTVARWSRNGFIPTSSASTPTARRFDPVAVNAALRSAGRQCRGC